MNLELDRNGRELVASYRVVNGIEAEERLGAGADRMKLRREHLQEQEARSG
ncbi:hypothetical protein DY000_02035132 [Brassica cretica]|uniref:Uncharacterized protein n=1 Tax=Brassica cretica TaxID=69181 RepID=A0ABQ7DFQ4_BRACR|nr:hypothetical protein DY000_02035132 [Brassica cretica]